FGIHLHAEIHVGQARLSSQIDHLMWQDTSDFNLSIQDFRPDLLASLSPQLKDMLHSLGGPEPEAWQHMTTPLSLTAKLKIQENGLPEGGQAELTLKSGTVFIPDLMAEPVPIQGAYARMNLDHQHIRLTEAKLMVSRGQAHATGEGVWDSAQKRLTITLQAKGKDIALDDLRFLWPAKLAPTPWTWVTRNIKGGHAPFATLNLKASLTRDDTGFTFATHDLRGDIGIHNANVHYMQGMPVVTQVHGVAHYDQANFNIDVSSGVTMGLALKPSKVLISKMDAEDQHIHLELAVEGPIRDALKVIDSPALRYAQMLGLNPEHVEGSSVSKTILDFPLSTTLTPREVKVETTATLHRFALKQPVAALPYDLTESELSLEVNNRGLMVSGQGLYHQTPMRLHWERLFDDRAKQQSKLRVETSLTPGVLRRFKIDASYIKSGEVPLKLTLQENSQGHGLLEAKADLTPAKIHFLGWEKTENEPAQALLALSLNKRSFEGIHKVELKQSNQTLIEGRALTDPKTGKWQGIDLHHIKFGPNDIQMTLIPHETHYAMTVRGHALDLQQWFQEEKQDQQLTSAFKVDANVAKVQLSPQGALYQTSLKAFYDGKRTQNLQFSAKLKEAKDHYVQASIQPSETGRAFSFYTNNAGASLRAFDILDNIASGEAIVTATNKDQQANSPWEGRILCTHFRILQAPLISHLLTLTSPTTILNILRSKEGIEMSVYRSKFSMNDRMLDLHKGRGHGSSLGFTLRGHVNRAMKTLDLHGTIIPAYALNTLISKIPLIGSLITGGRHEGLWAVNYHISGPSSDPQASVNPLSALTPGIIRRIFEPTPEESMTEGEEEEDLEEASNPSEGR
ncbi:MAG: AsmA-like C-terminal domain-containing protein, partial [Holosporales bacterium]